MTDQTGRTIDYMRISVTDRCNLRCRYCMPDGISQVPMSEILTYEEITEVCTLAAELGIRKIKVTGGEPLVRKGCAGLIREIKNVPGISQVTMTTNGVLLREYLDELADAGIDGINISLDTLDRERYHRITGTDACETVRQAILASIERDIPTKVNAVLQKQSLGNASGNVSGNAYEKDWKDLIRLAKDLPVDVRFIELMPIGAGKEGHGVSNAKLIEEIRQCYPGLQKDERIHGNGPAVYYRIPGFSGSVGFISAMHGKFCGTCNRIRLTSTGEIKPCLCYGDTWPVRDLLRSKDTEKVKEMIRKAIETKPSEHCFETPQEISEEHQMAQIGG